MRIALHLVLRVVMLVSLTAFSCASEHGSFRPGQGLSRNSQATGQRNTPQPNLNRDSLLQEADALTLKASALRQKQTQADLYAAIRLFQRAAQLFSAGYANDKAGGAYNQIGEIAFILSRYDQAVSAFQQAIKLAGQAEQIRCPALSSIARVYATTGRRSDADNYSRQAISLCADLSDSRLRAEALEARGEFALNSSMPSEAAELFRLARNDFANAKDSNGQALALLQLSYALWYGSRAEALQAAAEALQLSENGNRYGVAQVRVALGLFASTTGEFETAQCNCKTAQEMFQKIGDQDNEAVALNVMGRVSLETGDPRTALEHYQRAWNMFAAVHDMLGGGEATSGMEKSRAALHQYELLLPLYDAKLALARRTENPALEASVLKDKAGVYAAEHHFAVAYDFYRRSLAKYRSLGHSYGEGDVLHALARLQVVRARYMSAISLLESARKLKDKDTGTGQVVEVAEIQYELADVYRRLDRLDDALAAIKQPIEFIETKRLSISQFDSRAAYFASVHRYYALYIHVLMLLHAQAPQAGFAEKAFAESEKSKVRSLLDLLTTSSHDAPCAELLTRQLEEAHDVHAARRLETSTAAAPSVLTLEQVQAEIGDEDTLLLEYALGDNKSYLWVVDQKHIVAHELPGAAEIQRLALKFRDAIAPRLPGDKANGIDRVQLDDPRYTSQLSRLLLGPVDLSRAKRVLIVPDGSLQYIPFAALPLGGKTIKEEILITHHEVVVLPSASVLNTLRKTAATRAPPAKLAAIFADPVFGRDDERIFPTRKARGRTPQRLPTSLTRAIEDTHGSLYIPRLVGSGDEARAIQQVFGSKSEDVLFAVGFQASREHVLQASLNDYKYVHIATHGIIDARRPEMSGLILSLIDERLQQVDGYLRLGDVYGLKLSADLVVLSSCDSAMGKDLASEGTIGLPRGFLYAGAKSVIASLWKVKDKETAALMAALYKRLQQGESVGAALRGAQLEMARHGRSPSDWAAFVLQGEYK